MLVCDTTKKRLIAFSGFFFALGIPDGFIYTTLAAALAEKGISLEIIGGILAMGTFPWTFKVILGLLIDRFPLCPTGSRRTWIIIGQIGVATGCASLLAFKNLAQLIPVLAWLVLIQNIFSALLDAAVDGFAIELLPDAEKGRANGFMRAANIVGVLVGGVFLSWIMTEFSWRTAVAVQAMLMFSACVFCWAVIEPKPVLIRAENVTISWKKLFWTICRGFSGKGPAVAIFVGVCAALAGALFETGANAFFIQKLGWTRQGFVSLSAGWSYLIAVSVALAAGVASDRFDRRKVAYIAAMGTALVIMALPVCRAYWSNSLVMGLLIVFQSITTSVLGVSLFSMYMDLSLREIAATQFSAYMAFLNFGGAFGEKVIGAIVAHWDWTVTFLAIGGLYGFAALALVFVRFPHRLNLKACT